MCRSLIVSHFVYCITKCVIAPYNGYKVIWFITCYNNKHVIAVSFFQNVSSRRARNVINYSLQLRVGKYRLISLCHQYNVVNPY